MTTAQSAESTRQKPLRLRPGVIIVVLQWLACYGLPIFTPAAAPIAAMGALLGWLALVVWWVFFSRAARAERWGGGVLMIAALAATRPLLHESIAKAGMGMLFFIYATPVLSMAFVLWATASRRLPQLAADWPRQAAMVATVVLACGSWTLFRTAGVTGEGNWDFDWRWAETPEDQLLAQSVDEQAVEEPATKEPAANEPAASELTPPMSVPAEDRAPIEFETNADWPGFRGSDRDAVVRGVQIETDWSASPPAEIWRQPIGPGWSSFAVGGSLLYTQEQRGDDEVVSCYEATTGELVWRHRDAARFWESQAGAGPRATPTLRAGRLYTFGATGVLNVLDADDGTVVWSRNAASDTDQKIPGWGFSSSPLVVDDLVIVHAGALIAYDLASGDPRWIGPTSGGYSSPHLATIGGVPQILMLSTAGATSFAPTDGKQLWQHPWTGGIVQPAQTANGDVLVSGGGMTGGTGMQRVAVAHNADGWTTEERWTSNRLKPNFSDFVVHQGHAFGFDGRILASINLENGERNWKGGRYGSGQLVLLPEQDLLLVLSEQGDLALVQATPDQFTELARFPAIEGKTWNHPVLIDDLLLVRNGQEMVAFRLS